MSKKQPLIMRVLGITHDVIGKSEIRIAWNETIYKYRTDKNTVERLEWLLVYRHSEANKRKAIKILKMESDYEKDGVYYPTINQEIPLRSFK